MILLELANEIGLKPKWVAGTGGGEYKSSCPRCGGDNRFSMQPNKQMKHCIGWYYCRQCKIGGDAIKFAREMLGLSFQEAVVRTNAQIDQDALLFNKILSVKNHIKLTNIIKPSDVWQEKATNFAIWAYQNIQKNPVALQTLKARGLPEQAVHKYKLGWCPIDMWREKIDWGITENGNAKKLWIPKGIVIPTFNKKGNVIRLKIRRDSYNDNDEFGKYIVISGSMNGLSIIGDINHKIMVAVEAELDAYACDYAAGDIICSVAVGNNIKTPDQATNYHANSKERLLISYDNDEAGMNMLKKWQSFYKHAEAFPTPIGKDIGEAISLGLDVRRWILMHDWRDSPDKHLIEWMLDYISERITTREAYIHFEKEIALGPTSPKAVSRELQNAFQMIKNFTLNDYE